MNRNYIIAAVLIITGIIVLLNVNQNDMSDYANFSDASSGDRVKVVGLLAKDKEMVYDPENNPNEFQFVMKDEKEVEKTVILKKPKPQDFELSEQIVVTGTLKDDIFYADDILMKCPSKYKDEEIAVKSQIN